MGKILTSALLGTELHKDHFHLRIGPACRKTNLATHGLHIPAVMLTDRTFPGMGVRITPELLVALLAVVVEDVLSFFVASVEHNQGDETIQKPGLLG